MRKIYDEYFHVPEEGEGVVREKVFFSRLTLSIVCMLICMLAMGYNAYAFFTTNIESTANVIQASTYTLDVNGVAIPAVNGSFNRAADERYQFTLQPGIYDFTLTKSEQATAQTGYAKIEIGERAFYTQQIGGVLDGNNQEIKSRTIRIKVDAETTIKIVECWGTYSGNTATPIAEDVIIESQKMIEVNGANSSSVAWANPTLTDASKESTPASNTDTKQPINGATNENSDSSETQQPESSQTQEGLPNNNEGNEGEIPSE